MVDTPSHISRGNISLRTLTFHSTLCTNLAIRRELINRGSNDINDVRVTNIGGVEVLVGALSTKSTGTVLGQLMLATSGGDTPSATILDVLGELLAVIHIGRCIGGLILISRLLAIVDRISGDEAGSLRWSHRRGQGGGQEGSKSQDSELHIDGEDFWSDWK